MRNIVLIVLCLCPFYQTLFAQLIITTIREGDSRVSQYSGIDGNYSGQVATFNVGGAEFLSNSDMEYDGQYYYGISRNDSTIRRFDSSGQFLNDLAVLRVENHPSQPNGLIPNQIGLAMDNSYYYSIGVNDFRVRQYDKSGIFIGDICSLHDQYGGIFSQTGLAKFGEFFYAIANNDNRVRKFDLTGAYIEDAFVLTNLGESGQNALFLGTGISLRMIPEPSSLSLLALGGVLVALRRRKKE